MKKISVIKEITLEEKRVILLPKHVPYFVKSGYEVYIESGAGEALNFSNSDYKAAGAQIVDTETAWTCSNLIFKYKMPQKSEYRFFRENLTLSAIFHAEGNKDLITKMCETKMTAFSYEFFETDDGIFPLAIPGGEIAGKIAFLYATFFLQSQYQGSGVLLADIVGSKKSKIVVIGYGNAGSAVIKMALALGNDVVIFGTNYAKMRKYVSTLNGSVKCFTIDRKILFEEIKDADAVFGAVLISTFDTPALIDEDMLNNMKKGSIIVDITCGYGDGYMPTFHKATSLTEPVYEYKGILHCKIDNLPAAYPITTTSAYIANALPYLLRFANAYYGEEKDYVSQRGKIINHGEIVHPVIVQHMRFYDEQDNKI